MAEFYAQMMGKKEEVRGQIGRVVYSKDGFLIARLLDGTTVKGSVEKPLLGTDYIFTGGWKEDPKFGRQFAFNSFRTELPSSEGAIAKYLDKNAKWIGPEIALRLLRAYGVDALKMLKSKPDEVAEAIQGLSVEHAREASAMLNMSEADEALSIGLNELVMGTGISDSATQAIKKRWGSNAPDKIRANPFCLTAINGIGFLLADKVRTKLGIENNDSNRIQAGILHVLDESAWSEGHTYLPENVLLAKASKLLNVNSELVQTGINQMGNNGEVSVS